MQCSPFILICEFVNVQRPHSISLQPLPGEQRHIRYMTNVLCYMLLFYCTKAPFGGVFLFFIFYFFLIYKVKVLFIILSPSQLRPAQLDLWKLHKMQHVSAFFGKSVLKCHLT